MQVFWQRSLILVLSAFLAGSALAQAQLGRETGLPIPRYVSINANEANMRRGPDLEYPIDWVYQRKGLPVRVIAESNQWRKVEDNEGIKGWFHYVLLSGRRTGLVTAESTTIYNKPSVEEIPIVVVEKGNVVNISACKTAWCAAEIDGHKGWIQKSAIWGVEADEVFED